MRVEHDQTFDQQVGRRTGRSRRLQAGAVGVLGVAALASAGLGAGFASAAVGDPIDLQVGTARTSSEYIGGPFFSDQGVKACPATILDPHNAGQSFRIEVAPECVDGYYLTGSGYGTLDEQDVIRRPFRVTVEGENRTVATSTSVLVDPQYSVTSIGTDDGGGGPASLTLFSAEKYPCSMVLLEVPADDGSYAGRDTGCVPVPRDVPITFTAMQVIGCNEEEGTIDEECGSGPDGGILGDGDYRINLTFEDGTTARIGGGRNSDGDFRGGRFYSFRDTISTSGERTNIVVEVVDADEGPDDLIDVNPLDNKLTITLSLNVLTGSWSWPQAESANQHWARGDGDTEHLNKGGFPALFVFDISVLEPDSSKNNSVVGDRDGDGLLDGWELWGLELPVQDQFNIVSRPTLLTTKVIDPAWGAADVNVPDLFIENDWLSDGTTSAIPVFNPINGDTYAEIVESFAAAPTPINLWIDTGALTDGTTYVTPAGSKQALVGEQGIDLGGGNEVVLDTGLLNGVREVCNVDADEFYDVKDVHFDPTRRWVFRYALNGVASVFPSQPKKDSNDPNRITCGLGGQAEINGNDILNLRSDAVVMMHELGHSINLRHGGDSNTHCKPNYVSVMNYVYDIGEGIPLDGSGYLLDYSPARYASGARSALMGPINESALNETVVLDPLNSEHRVRYSDGAGGDRREQVANRNLDYSGDHSDPPFEAGTTSVNNQRGFASSCRDTNENETLTDHDDWDNVILGFRPSGEFGDAGIAEISDETGMHLEEDDTDALKLALGRADLELSASAGPVVDGVVEVTASVRSLDNPDVNAPMVEFVLSPGVTVAVLPQGCELNDSGVVCNLGSLPSGRLPTEPKTVVVPLLVDPGAVNPETSLTATSQNNPVSNDPDPTNNTVTFNLDGQTQPQPPNAVDDSESTMLGETILADVLANDTDPDDDLNPGSLTVTVPPTLGTAQVVDDGEGPEIEYTPAAVGVDLLTYQVCDDTGQCDTATLTVTVLDVSDCTILGTTGNDTLTGTPGPDIICGLGGKDTINGFGGDDIIFGGRGADTIDGGAGDDLIIGGRGADQLHGGDGADEIRGRRGKDTIFGDAGNDELYGGAKADTIDGGAGDDLIIGGRGADQLHGGDGADLIRGRRGKDTIFGGDGNDELHGGKGTDAGDGGAGADSCQGIETETSCET